jgi:thymidylate synthase (FAD)
MSGRYKQLPKEFYLPPTQAIRTQIGKPGNYKFEPMAFNEASVAQNIISEVYRKNWDAYIELLEMGVAKEVARNVLPLGTMTQFTFKANLRSLFNFFNLRSDKSAMKEIREYSEAMEDMVAEVVPITWEAYLKIRE